MSYWFISYLLKIISMALSRTFIYENSIKNKLLLNRAITPLFGNHLVSEYLRFLYYYPILTVNNVFFLYELFFRGKVLLSRLLILASIKIHLKYQRDKKKPQ